MIQRQGLVATLLLTGLLAGCAGLYETDQSPPPPPPAEQGLPSNGVMILQCGGTPLRVTLHDEEALIEAMQGQYILKRVASASGARYVAPDDSTTSFWNQGAKGMLTIKGETFPECEPASALVLQAGEWVVEDINRQGIIDSSRMTLRFGNDGRVSGLASCNNYVGAYELNGQQLGFSQLTSTRKACAPALNGQETKFLKALENVTRFHLDNTGALVLETSDGGALTARLQ
ncbi:META domain-containing protein [Halopseudomonas pachastrellae]|uniref:META domain-containing protein n=1 Tax=Halopseudomonas pachastrellae TaxID=254161 RepID=UPI003D7EE2D1|tara:strand:- start:9 stop:701 length:693 start_codon:yes stop_codon:yes gene_type:complete